MMHRYPGSRSFTSDDQHLFFGRDDAIQELFRLIVLNDLVVLFGESGCGKTSLLQAGVCPQLEENRYKPVFIRLNNTAENLEVQVCHQLKEGGYIPADQPEDRSLWEYFSRFWYVDLGEVFTPVFVFDQFEELFTLYKPEQRSAFITQFAAIINRRPPSGWVPQAKTPPQTKFVLSLRSDFLYLLDELSADIPAILRCRFQLRPLDRERAEAAITRPASMPGDFASPGFGYSPEALEDILEALGRKGTSSIGGNDYPVTPQTKMTEVGFGEIAAFQLQMLCQYLEEKIIRQKKAAGFQITPAFYGHEEGIGRIIDEFYNGVLEKVPLHEQEAIQKLLARGLIRNGRRIMMESSSMRDEYGISKETLELLQAERLLKRETRKGEYYFEISHDTLVLPILERFKAVEEAELREKAAAAEKKLLTERLRAEEAERLRIQAEEEKRRAQKMMFLAIGMALLACLGLLGVCHANTQIGKERDNALHSDSLAQESAREAQRSDSIAQKKAREAQRSDSLAQIEKKNAEQALKKAQQEQLNKLLSDAALFRKEKRYADAIRAYETARQLNSNPAERSRTTADIIRTRNEKAQADFERNRDIGIGLKEANQCKAAIPYLEAALATKPDDVTTQKALADCKTNIPKQ